MGAQQTRGDVEYESGLSRLGNAFCAVLLSPFVLLAAAFLVGWNEKNAVCSVEALHQARDSYHNVGCSTGNATGDNLIYFTCDVDRSALPVISLAGKWTFKGMTGIAAKSEMYQCVEASQSVKDSTGGGKTTQYSYSMAWKEAPVDSHRFHNQPGTYIQGVGQHPCRFHNPPWPDMLPRSGRTDAESATIGSYTVRKNLVEQIPLTIAVTPIEYPSLSFRRNGFDFASRAWVQPDGEIGQVRTKFSGNDWSTTKMSVMGKNSGGTILPWKAKASWGCGGNTVEALKVGDRDVEDFMDELEQEASAMKWIMRAVGFIVLWVGFCMCFAPLEVFADCVPFLGPCLGDSIACVTGCFSCLPAFACYTLVAGVMWVFMRPLVGGCMLLVFAAIVSLLIGLKCVFGGKRPPPMAQQQMGYGYGAPVTGQPAYGAF